MTKDEASDVPTLREALEAIADGEGDAVVIAQQTLDANPVAATRLEALQAQPVGEDLAPRKAVNRILGELLGPLIPDFVERMTVGNRVCSLILPALTASPPVVEREADSGMSGDDTKRAEWVWTDLPTGNRTWASLNTGEKALVCHVLSRVTANVSAPAAVDGMRQVIAAAYIKGAADVHSFWTDNPGEAPRGDGEFAEAGYDYANAALDMFSAVVREPTPGSSTPVAQGDEVRDALEPFAELAQQYDPPEGDDDLPLMQHDGDDLNIGMLRRARTALATLSRSMIAP